MPVEHFEMRWRCSTCKTENLGRHKTCQHCGKPKGREAFYDAPAHEEIALRDPKLVKQATAGSDWECAYCGSHQRRDSGECAECGAEQGRSRGHKTKWDDGDEGPSGQGITDAELAELMAKQEARIVGRARARGAPTWGAPKYGNRIEKLSPKEVEALKAEQDAEILRVLFDNPTINAPADVTRERVKDAARQIGISLGVHRRAIEEVRRKAVEGVGPPGVTDDEIDELVERAKRGAYRGGPDDRKADKTPPPIELEPESEPEPESWRPPFWTKRKKWAAVGLLAASLIGVLCYFLFRTRIVDATVTAVQWVHTVEVERYQITSGEGFAEDKPGDAFDVVSVGMRHHHYDRVPDGTKQVPYQEQYQCGENCTTTPRVCSSNQNGFKTCSGGDRVCSPRYCTRTKYRTETKYRDVSVEKMYYHWKVWRWRHHRNVVANGTTDEPHWPSAEQIALNENLGRGEKERERRHTKYVVTFTDTDGDEHSYKPDGLGEFMDLRPGVQKRLRVGVARGTQIVKGEDG